MKIDILYFEGCPNHAPAVQAVRDVVRELGADADIREIEVRSADDASRLRFFGSPTIQVEGEDAGSCSGPRQCSSASGSSSTTGARIDVHRMDPARLSARCSGR
jgi:hypothetical protein